jgi:hypothetical protein
VVNPSVELAHVGFPPLDAADELPKIEPEEYERRMAALAAAVDADWVVTYGDREHVGNLAFLCGFDPRFEEALLVLGRGKRRLIVGTEGLGYSRFAPVDLERVWVPMFSLMGIDRSGGLTLAQALAESGIARGHRVGVVGWKAFGASEWSADVPAIAAPAFVVDALRAVTGGPEHVVDVTRVLMNNGDGLRITNSADQLAYFEWGASRSSAAVSQIILSSRPGLPESALLSAMTYKGEPFSYHPILTSGPDIPNGLRSPTNRIVELGDAVFVTIGMWGGNCGRGGILGTSEADCRPENAGFLERVAIPYWRTIVAWFETVRVGVSGGDVYRTLAEFCREQGFRPALGTGHLQDWEDWPNTPIRCGSSDVIKSGMLFASDIFSDANGPQRIAHCEDTVAVADQDLRAELTERHPKVWGRISARRRFMRELLGIQVPDDLLPFSVAPAYFPPFWLAPDMAVRMLAL